jgi:RNA recognition motif-containing protein
MPVRLFVGNLPYTATEAELREHFSAVGPISYLSLPTDRESGQPRGFAFVEFSDRAQAEEAIRRFNNQLFKGRLIAVSEARARENRPQAGASARPSISRRNSVAEPDGADPLAPSGKPSPDFGPDAPPRRNRSKSKSGPKSERGSKGPMREVVRGQFFGGDEDEDDADDEELNEENFDSSKPEPETRNEDLSDGKKIEADISKT